MSDKIMSDLVELKNVIKATSRIPSALAVADSAVKPVRIPTDVMQVNLSSALATVGGLAMTPGGRTAGFGHIDLGSSGALPNKWAQFDIVNAAGADVKLRIGSSLGLPGAAAELGLAAGAADNAGVSDHIGAACLGVRAFSRVSCSKPILATEIQITSDDNTQLNSEINTLDIKLDGTVETSKINVSSTNAMSDNRTNMLIVPNISAILDATHALEFTSKAGKSVTIKLKCEAWSNIGLFVEYGS